MNYTDTDLPSLHSRQYSKSTHQLQDTPRAKAQVYSAPLEIPRLLPAMAYAVQYVQGKNPSGHTVLQSQCYLLAIAAHHEGKLGKRGEEAKKVVGRPVSHRKEHAHTTIHIRDRWFSKEQRWTEILLSIAAHLATVSHTLEVDSGSRGT